ncbi:ATPase [Clostridia bacterium]|nr:ATPase [Clostridia bacterium]
MKTDGEIFESEKNVLGIELGSTRIKAVLLNARHETLGTGEYEWENTYLDTIWTYGVEDVWKGVQSCYADLKRKIKDKFGVCLKTFGAIGISAMMHGYMVFDKSGELLTPFRTWRNNNAAGAAEELTALFGYSVPARWSIAHLYQAIKSGEKHVGNIEFLSTLAAYVHWRLTGRRVAGVGDASGMFPIDFDTKQYDRKAAERFDCKTRGTEFNHAILDVLPQVLLAGENAGYLTTEGATLLDPSGDLEEGIAFCPPEGDAGTGMVATNSVKRGTGNVSAGTSIFSMVVLEKGLTRTYPEIDIVTTPDGNPVAMVHCNNCTSEINAWIALFEEYTRLFGITPDKKEIFGKLFESALGGDADCGGVVAYNYVSSEHITRIEEGRPMLVRTTSSKFNLANFMRAELYSLFATLKVGLDILQKGEGVKIRSLYGHGGVFKTKGVCQRFLAAATDSPVTVMETANEGGAWGMAVLARFMSEKANGRLTLAGYLDDTVFKDAKGSVYKPEKEDVAGFERYMQNFVSGLAIVKEAVAALGNQKAGKEC